MSIREALEAIRNYCTTSNCNKCEMLNYNIGCEARLPPADWDIDSIIKYLGIQEKEPRKLKRAIPTIELATQVIADMERGTPFCTAYRRLNLPEAKLRIVINSDEELLARYKKAILITRTERKKKYWKG